MADLTTERTRSGASTEVHRWLLFGRRLLDAWLVVIVVVLGVSRFTVSTSIVAGPSMEPTLRDGDTIIVSTRSFPSLGDVVTADISTAAGRSHPVVKRVVAGPGDTIEYRDCELVRNGSVVDEPYLGASTPIQHCGAAFDSTVLPPGHVWLMGDNRAESVDSRAYGPVGLDAVVGVLVWIL